MNDYLDSFVDTKRKRCLLVKTLCWAGWIVIACFAIYTSVRLMALTDYASLFSLLNDETMQLYVIARMVLSMMSAPSGVLSYLYSAGISIHIWEWILLMLSLFLLYYSRHKSFYYSWIILVLLYLLGCILLFIKGCSASSLQDVVNAVRIIGISTAVFSSLCLIACVISFIRILFAYHKEMQWHVTEVYDQDVGQVEKQS